MLYKITNLREKKKMFTMSFLPRYSCASVLRLVVLSCILFDFFFVFYFIFSAPALDCYYIRKRRPGASSGSKCIHRKAALASPSAPRHTHTTTPTPTRHTPRTRTQTHKRTQRTKEKWETEIVALYYKPTICWRHNLPTLKEPILEFAQESTPIYFFFLSVATVAFVKTSFVPSRFSFVVSAWCLIPRCLNFNSFSRFGFFPPLVYKSRRENDNVVATVVVVVLEKIVKEGRKEKERKKEIRWTDEE